MRRGARTPGTGIQRLHHCRYIYTYLPVSWSSSQRISQQLLLCSCQSMHFKEDSKRFAKKTVIKYTTLQKGRWNFFQIFIWSTYDLIFLNLSWEWGGKPQMSIRCHPERHWSVLLRCQISAPLLWISRRRLPLCSKPGLHRQVSPALVMASGLTIGWMLL